MCPSRPYKYGRACIYGHLWEIARITPVFLWFCPYFLQKSARIFTNSLSSLRFPNAALTFSWKSFHFRQSFSDMLEVWNISTDWLSDTRFYPKMLKTCGEISSQLVREIFWILISRYWFVLFLHSGLPAVSVYQFSVGWMLCFLKWTFDCLIFGV